MTSSIDTLIDWRIRARRAELGLTPEILAEMIGTNAEQLLDYEAGKRRAGAEALISLCTALDVPMSYFYD